jgi:hypothetical protein
MTAFGTKRPVMDMSAPAAERTCQANELGPQCHFLGQVSRARESVTFTFRILANELDFGRSTELNERIEGRERFREVFWRF